MFSRSFHLGKLREARGPHGPGLGPYSHGASLHPGVEMGTGEFNAGVAQGWTSIPPRGE